MFAGSVQAASITNETFSVNLQGWSNAGLRSWTWQSGGHLRVSFPPSPPSPGDHATLKAGPTASSGSYTGNYVTAGINLIGFDFMAESTGPATFNLDLIYGTNRMSVALVDRVVPSNGWQTIAVSLRHKADGPWFGPANEGQFQTWLQDISGVEIRIVRHADQAEIYRLDNFFAVRQSAMTEMVNVGPEAMAMAWTDVLIGRQYRVEATQNLSGNEWIPIALMVTTNNTMYFVDEDVSAFPHRAYRITLP